MYTDELVLYGESEQNLRAMVSRFVEVCRRGLKVNKEALCQVLRMYAVGGMYVNILACARV